MNFKDKSKTVQFLTMKILAEIQAGKKKSQGLLTSREGDYLVTIQRVSKKTWRNLWGLLHAKA